MGNPEILGAQLWWEQLLVLRSDPHSVSVETGLAAGWLLLWSNGETVDLNKDSG